MNTSSTIDDQGNNGRFIGETITKLVLLILNSIGNFLVIQAVLKTQRLRTASNYLVVNLALCDLLSPLLNIPIDISVESVSYAWHYGPVLCKIVWPLATMLTTCSALTLVAISIDRSRALRHPFVTKISSRQALVVIFCLHALSLVVIIPYSLASVVAGGECTEDWTNNIFKRSHYTLFIFVVQYAVPLVVLTFVYGGAARHLHQSTLTLLKFEINEQVYEDTAVLKWWRSPARFTHRESSKSIRMRGEQNARVVKMFAVVVAVFAIFTLPNNVLWLLTDFADYNTYKHFDVVAFCCVMCTYINCLANPIIYGTLSRDYKNYFLRVFATIHCRCCPNVLNVASLTSPSMSFRKSWKDFRSDANAKEAPVYV